MGTIVTDNQLRRLSFWADNPYEYRLMLDRIKRANEIISACENNPKNKLTQKTKEANKDAKY
jgi:hypothetical protein